jgi:ubiquinone/menaquinone biosynthesis C-methylase UbiE
MVTGSAASELASTFVCPRCRGSLRADSDAYDCRSCNTRYPITREIPDFRVFPDPWIGLEEDRDKARQLEDRSQGESLETMVRTYWSMTPGTPDSQAERFIDHVLNAEARSREWLARLDDTAAVSGLPWLDIGTGTGDIVAASATRGVRVVGVDIAMRWLVVARRRAQLAGIPACFVCCNAEHLPFPDAAFGRVISVGTIEHCEDGELVCREARRVLHEAGDIRIRTVNRFTLLREPHVDVWGVGFVPRRFADRYVRWRSGHRYEHHRPLSARELKGSLRRARFRDVHVDPASLLTSERARLGSLAWAAPAYEWARAVPVLRAALRWTVPLLEARGLAA